MSKLKKIAILKKLLEEHTGKKVILELAPADNLFTPRKVDDRVEKARIAKATEDKKNYDTLFNSIAKINLWAVEAKGEKPNDPNNRYGVEYVSLVLLVVRASNPTAAKTIALELLKQKLPNSILNIEKVENFHSTDKSIISTLLKILLAPATYGPKGEVKNNFARLIKNKIKGFIAYYKEVRN